MSTTAPPPTGLAKDMKTAFVRYCGEQRIAYKPEVLELLSKVGARVAVQRQARREARPVTVPAPAPVEPLVPALPLSLDLGQVELLELIAEGFGDERIARRLGASVYATKRRVRHLLTALDADCRTTAVALGYEFGILGAGPRAARKRAARASDGPGGAGGPGVPPAVQRAPGGPVESAGFRHSRTLVLALLAEGLDNGAIQERLGLSPKQVKYRLQYWYTNSGTKDRPALVAWARRNAATLGPEAGR